LLLEIDESKLLVFSPVPVDEDSPPRGILPLVRLLLAAKASCDPLGSKADVDMTSKIPISNGAEYKSRVFRFKYHCCFS
jgi:hypothetical protein